MKIRTSPWGEVQHQYIKAEGLVLVSTAGHGGYYLSGERWQAVMRLFPQFESYAGPQWLEEDCDCVLAVLAFPDLYSDEEIWSAVRMVRIVSGWEHTGGRWDCVVHFLDHDQMGLNLVFKANRFEESFKHLWEYGSMSSDGYEPREWMVSFTRVGDKARRTVSMPYPEKRFFTSEELDRFRPYEEPKPKPQPAVVAPAASLNTFREEECGGVFDGFGTVTSDADPGL